jgi:Domain of Unknown Function with PDB structure (DUF3857)/Transglutaminase-like superfamily
MLSRLCPVRTSFQPLTQRPALAILLFLICLACPSPGLADKEDWQPITPQDLQTKEVPGDPSAAAIQLYYSDLIDDSNQSEFIYHRIKILTEKGKHKADVEIPAGTGISVKDLKARTIRPDGSIVDFTGKPFDKTIVKAHGFKVSMKTFTMPEAGVGSIIEYKYRLQFEHTLTTDNWILQHDLFTVRESFSFKPLSIPGRHIAWVNLHVTQEQRAQETKGGHVELELQNVRAFESEEYMPPEDNYKPSVHFFYLSSDINTHSGNETVDSFWQLMGKISYEIIEKFIGNSKESRQAAAEAIGTETNPENKLRKLYARAQQIRNLSYERERTEKEMKKENLKENDGVGEILRRGYGDRSDIVMAFVAMARAAGFDAFVILASDRSKEFFVKEVLSPRQLGREIADVKLNGQDVYLDPGTKYCPYGLLPWKQTAATALKPDKKNSTFITLPSFGYDKAVTRRSVSANLDSDGSLKAVVQLQFEGLEALVRRLEAVDKDEAGRKQDLEDELKDILPSGANIKLKEVQGWETSDQPLVARFSAEIPGYASTAGKRLLVPPYLFQLKHKDAFSHADRKYPVYFPFTFAELDAININFPPGYEVEGNPSNQRADLPYAHYQLTSKMDGAQLQMQRALLVNGLYFDVSKYSEVKDFFSKVQTGDEQQTVLRMGANSASKSN